MRYQIELFLTALQFLTRLPSPSGLPFSQERLRQSTAYYPLVGLLVGGLIWLCHWACCGLWSPLVASILACAWALLITGAFHEDGWADCWDGLGGGWNRQRVLEIMQDSRLGTFGVAGLVLALALRVVLWTQLPAAALAPALLWAHCYSRYLAITVAFAYAYVGREGNSKPTAFGIARSTLFLASGWTILAGMGLSPAWPALVWPALGSCLFGIYLQRRLGGYTGDCLGATQLGCELACYLSWI